jgi:hypothetical protein
MEIFILDLPPTVRINLLRTLVTCLQNNAELSEQLTFLIQKAKSDSVLDLTATVMYLRLLRTMEAEVTKMLLDLPSLPKEIMETLQFGRLNSAPKPLTPLG